MSRKRAVLQAHNPETGHDQASNTEQRAVLLDALLSCCWVVAQDSMIWRSTLRNTNQAPKIEP
ncbi:hypothetical protein ACFSKU_08820 [Pontibacter silvestris]|uniref:Uncharacterized protein n=1 Tax=Pontibacter silvestris TaxID=2305183 RepID=A0ABW4WW70_9BACT